MDPITTPSSEDLPVPAHKPGDVFHPDAPLNPTNSPAPAVAPVMPESSPAMQPLGYNQSANEQEIERTKRKKSGRILLIGGGVTVAVGLSLLGYYGVQQARSRFGNNNSTDTNSTATSGLIKTSYNNGQGDVFEILYPSSARVSSITSLSALQDTQTTSAAKPDSMAIVGPPSGKAKIALATSITRGSTDVSNFESGATCTTDFRFKATIAGSEHKVCGVKANSSNAQLIYLSTFVADNQGYVVMMLLDYDRPTVLADKELAQKTLDQLDLAQHDDEIKQILASIRLVSHD